MTALGRCLHSESRSAEEDLGDDQVLCFRKRKRSVGKVESGNGGPRTHRPIKKSGGSGTTHDAITLRSWSMFAVLNEACTNAEYTEAQKLLVLSVARVMVSDDKSVYRRVAKNYSTGS